MDGSMERGHQRSIGDMLPPSGQQASAPKRAPEKVRGFLKRRWWVIVLALVVLIGVGLLAYGYLDTRSKLVELSSDAQTSGQSQRDKLVSEIGKYLELPKETPTLATVSDVSRLKGQEFFKNAKNGDNVLIYSEAGRALLYRPSTHKVIEYSKVNLKTDQTP